jgi:hypothetical protein
LGAQRSNLTITIGIDNRLLFLGATKLLVRALQTEARAIESFIALAALLAQARDHF